MLSRLRRCLRSLWTFFYHPIIQFFIFGTAFFAFCPPFSLIHSREPKRNKLSLPKTELVCLKKGEFAMKLLQYYARWTPQKGETSTLPPSSIAQLSWNGVTGIADTSPIGGNILHPGIAPHHLLALIQTRGRSSQFLQKDKTKHFC